MEDIIVFGHGRYYQSKKETIKQLYNVTAFIDNAVKLDEELFDEKIPIYNPIQIRMLPPIPVITMSTNFFEMAMQLLELDVDETRIRFGVFLTPYYDRVEKVLSDIGYSIEMNGKNLVLLSPENKYIFQNKNKYHETIRAIIRDKYPYMKLIADMPLEPLSRRFGLEYGKAVDRFYIEKFLNENRKYITGDVLEIADNTYTNMFGEHVEQAYSLHVNGWGKDCIKGNLETGEGIIENSIDCLICTQTIECILGTREVIKNIYRILRNDGTALITMAGIKQISLYDYYNWGEYWRFTKQTMERLLSEVFKRDQVEVVSYGNIKTTFAMLYGVCQEELDEKDFEYNDEQFPLIIAAKVKK